MFELPTPRLHKRGGGADQPEGGSKLEEDAPPPPPPPVDDDAPIESPKEVCVRKWDGNMKLN